VFTLEESALLSRMLRFLAGVLVLLAAGAAGYLYFR
jgi:hypothetical protein